MRTSLIALLISLLFAPAPRAQENPDEIDLEVEITEIERERRRLEAESQRVEEQIEEVEGSIAVEHHDLNTYDYNLSVTNQRLASLRLRAAAKRERIALYRERLESALMPVALNGGGALRPSDVSLVAVAERYSRQIGVLTEDLEEIEAEIVRLDDYRRREFDLISVAEGNLETHTRRIETRTQTLEEIQRAMEESDERLNDLISTLNALPPRILLPGAVTSTEVSIELPPPGPRPMPLINLPEIELAAGEEEITLAVVERGEGLEIEVPPGTIVRAPRRGEVVYAGPLEGYGDVVIVDHGDGTVSISASVSEVRVQVGDAVDIGDPLAEAGRLRETGAPGFHFEVRREEETIDAISWLGSEDLRAALMGREGDDE